MRTGRVPLGPGVGGHWRPCSIRENMLRTYPTAAAPARCSSDICIVIGAGHATPHSGGSRMGKHGAK